MKNIVPETYERCPKCGHLVFLPCLACLLEGKKRMQTEESEEIADDLRLSLREKEYRRYQQIRQSRQDMEIYGSES